MIMRFECTFDGYVPLKSNDRFMELVLAALEDNDMEFLEQQASDEAITALQEIYPIPNQNIEVIGLDFLNTEYNYRVYFSDSVYFDVWLDYTGWEGSCPGDNFTDFEVIDLYYLVRVSGLIAP
jgi:hypothetical protein